MDLVQIVNGFIPSDWSTKLLVVPRTRFGICSKGFEAIILLIGLGIVFVLVGIVDDKSVTFVTVVCKFTTLAAWSRLDRRGDVG
jgi:hypothetical protein